MLPLTDGTTLRTFLSKLLNCDPMRISKKFVGSNCIGKQVAIFVLCVVFFIFVFVGFRVAAAVCWCVGPVLSVLVRALFYSLGASVLED